MIDSTIRLHRYWTKRKQILSVFQWRLGLLDDMPGNVVRSRNRHKVSTSYKQCIACTLSPPNAEVRITGIPELIFIMVGVRAASQFHPWCNTTNSHLRSGFPKGCHIWHCPRQNIAFRSLHLRSAITASIMWTTNDKKWHSGRPRYILRVECIQEINILYICTT